jgi:hypothetical protein
MFLPAHAGHRVRQGDTLATRLARLGEHYRHRSASRQAHRTTRWHALATSRALRRMPQRVPDANEVREFAFDMVRRTILFLDVLRWRGNDYLAYEASGQPPLLAFDYEVLIDGRHLPDPVNCLVRIVAPPGVTVDPAKRPYLIIDPRAGHGAGIGGLKQESQVGVALREGNPVYFAVFLFAERRAARGVAGQRAGAPHAERHHRALRSGAGRRRGR